jgi:hypothetical protein
MHSEAGEVNGHKTVLRLADLNWKKHLLSIIGTVLTFDVSLPFFVKAIIAKRHTFDSWGDTSDVPLNDITAAGATLWSIGYYLFEVAPLILMGYLTMIVFIIMANPIAKYFEPSFKWGPSFFLIQVLCIICMNMGSKAFLSFGSYKSNELLFGFWGAVVGYVACYTLLHVASRKKMCFAVSSHRAFSSSQFFDK